MKRFRQLPNLVARFHTTVGVNSLVTAAMIRARSASRRRRSQARVEAPLEPLATGGFGKKGCRPFLSERTGIIKMELRRNPVARTEPFLAPSEPLFDVLLPVL